MNIKIGQHNTNYIHKKSESTGMGYKNKVKKIWEMLLMLI